MMKRRKALECKYAELYVRGIDSPRELISSRLEALEILILLYTVKNTELESLFGNVNPGENVDQEMDWAMNGN